MLTEYLRAVADDTERLPAVLVVLLLLSSTAGVVVGLSITSLSTQKASLFASNTSASDFTIASFDTKVQGFDQVDVDVTLENTDTTTHAANVTVEVVNETSGTVVSDTQSTGDVNGGNTVTLKFSFQESDLADRYDSVNVIVDQTDA